MDNWGKLILFICFLIYSSIVWVYFFGDVRNIREIRGKVSFFLRFRFKICLLYYDFCFIVIVKLIIWLILELMGREIYFIFLMIGNLYLYGKRRE